MRQIQKKKCNKTKKDKTDKYTKNMVRGDRQMVHPVFFDEGFGDEASRTHQRSRQPRTCWLQMLMRARRMSFVWSEFRVAQASAGCISSPSSSPPSKMFVCRKRIAKMCGSIERQGM